MIRIIVVDDEAPARNELIFLLKKHSDVEIVSEAEDAHSAIQAIEQEKPDAVFIDIHMPGGTGMKVAKEISQFFMPPLVIFATAYHEHAAEAFTVNAVDYLLKPFSASRVSETLNKIRLLLKNKKVKNIMQEKIAVIEEDQITLLNSADIIYAVRQGKGLIIKTYNHSYHNNYTLQMLERRLDSHSFFRPHHSFLVNANMIKKIEPWFKGHQLIMKDQENSKIPVSRSGMKEIRQLLEV